MVMEAFTWHNSTYFDYLQFIHLEIHKVEHILELSSMQVLLPKKIQFQPSFHNNPTNTSKQNWHMQSLDPYGSSSCPNAFKEHLTLLLVSNSKSFTLWKERQKIHNHQPIISNLHILLHQ